jgi:hypothetical protein
VVIAALVVGAIEQRAGFAGNNPYLEGGIGGVVGAVVWQLTARQKPRGDGASGL